MADHAMEEEVFTGKIDWALWRKVLVFARPYRRHLLTLVGLAGLVAVCDVLLPYLTGRIVDEIKARGRDADLLRYGLLYAGVIAAFAVCVMGFILTCGRIATGVSYDIREAAFSKLQDLPFAYYDRKAVGWLMARLTSDCNQLSRIMGWALLDIAWGSIALLAVSAMMFALSWKLALVVLLIVPPLAIVTRYFQVRLLLTSRALRKANSQATAAFNEGIVGVRTTKSLVRESRNLEEFGTLTGAMYGHAVANALYQALFLPLVLSICAFGTGLALWRGGIDASVGALSLGVLVTFLQYAGFVQGPVQELANAITMIQGAQASAERIQSLLDEPVTIKDSDEVVRDMAESNDNGNGNDNGRAGVAIDGHADRIESIEFRDVSFEYLKGQPVLKHFNLSVRAGETIALVGPTGGGKSTIVALACRFYEPTAGQVLINGVDYRRRSLHWLQSNLGMVLQQPHLFSGTIRENIRYGRLAATDVEIEEAARTANADEFITSTPKGYDTSVGEGGNQLSTGQKQLVSLARAIIANPQLFVMDEATSSVDTQTERLVQDAIERVLEGRISFVIAHRLSTIRSADRILVISGGRVIEQGSHHQLIRRRGHYYELYTNQFTHEHEEQVLAEEDARAAGATA
jgi:ATP-binding cassette, subfamily B, bacterial